MFKSNIQEPSLINWEVSNRINLKNTRVAVFGVGGSWWLCLRGHSREAEFGPLWLLLMMNKCVLTNVNRQIIATQKNSRQMEQK